MIGSSIHQLNKSSKGVKIAAVSTYIALALGINGLHKHQEAKGVFPRSQVEYQGSFYQIYDGSEQRAIRNNLYWAIDNNLDGVVDEVRKGGPARIYPGPGHPIPIPTSVEREISQSDQQLFERVFETYKEIEQRKSEQKLEVEDLLPGLLF